MSASTTQNQRSRPHSNALGKNISVSFGFHELQLIDDLDKLAHYECVNRSQWIRRRIREERRKLKEQEAAMDDQRITWNTLIGDR
jgi:metal-responsive CopG/Arc/MetJ family transcriptional regulator